MKTQNSTSVIASFHNDLKLAKERIYDRCALTFTNPLLQTESTEYAACSFELNTKKIQHRLSKITPTKIGQFVTIWKRNAKGITQPYDVSDGIDFFIITSRKEDRLGQFIFPCAALAAKGIISQNGKTGKRGIRVYPPWDRPTSKQALATQAWQLPFFIPIYNDDSINIDFIRILFNEPNEPLR